VLSYEHSWQGNRIPVDSLTLTGSVKSWHKGSRGLIEVGEFSWRTSFEVVDTSLDEIDRATMCRCWPVFLDLVRDSRAMASNQYRATGLRVSWRKVLDLYGAKMAEVGVAPWSKILRYIRPSRNTTGRPGSFRPLAAVVALPPVNQETGNLPGLLRPIGESKRRQVSFSAQDTWPPNTTFKAGEKVFFWSLVGSDRDQAVLVLAKPKSDGFWPAIAYSPPTHVVEAELDDEA
jgi:hypothetical protein